MNARKEYIVCLIQGAFVAPLWFCDMAKDQEKPDDVEEVVPPPPTPSEAILRVMSLSLH